MAPLPPRAVRFASAVAVLCPTPFAARSAPLTAALDPVIAELEERRDTDYAGELDKAGKQQRSAVLKALKKADKASTSVKDDIVIAGRMSAALEKRFLDEYVEDGFSNKTADLGPLFRSALDQLEGSTRIAEQLQRERVPSLSAKGGTKVTKKLDAALVKIDASHAIASPKKRATALLKGALLVIAAKKIADKDKGPTGGGTSLTATIGTDAFTGDGDTKIEVYSDNDDVVIASPALTATGQVYIYFHIHNVTGTGPKTFASGDVEGFINVFTGGAETGVIHNITAGSITFDAFDRKKRIAGSFSFTTQKDASTIEGQDGLFDIANIERY